MGFIARETIDEIKQRVSIIDVVAPYVSLKRSGSGMVGLSPFNAEKTPSFYIWPDKNIFKCFSSNQAGDAFTFVRLVENLEFNEAVEYLAEKFSIVIRYESGGLDEQKRSLRKDLLLLHEKVGAFFAQCLKEQDEEGRFAEDYLLGQRGFSKEICDQYQLGWAPADGARVVSHLRLHAFADEVMRQSGLFYGGPQGFRSRFRGRLMIPIRDIQGRIVAFTARQTKYTPEDDPAAQAKYVNSPETPLFNKGRLLFNLHHARKHVREGEAMMMVEGQLDAIRCVEKGVEGVVAPQGTAITVEQLQLVRRYTNRLECFLDGDRAGQKAAYRMLPMALAEGIDLSFLPLPEGVDPDSLLEAEGGLDALQRLRAKKLGPMAFLVSYLLPTAKEREPAVLQNSLQEAFAVLEKVESQVICQSYLQELAQLLQLDMSALGQDFMSYLRSQRQRMRTPGQQVIAGQGIRGSATDSEKLTSVEEVLCSLLFTEQELCENIAQLIDHEWIDVSKTAGVVLARVLAEIQEGLWEGSNQADHLWETDEQRDEFYRILSDDRRLENPKQLAVTKIKELYLSYYRKQLQQVDEVLKSLPKEDEDTWYQLTLQRKNLAVAIKTVPHFTI